MYKRMLKTLATVVLAVSVMGAGVASAKSYSSSRSSSSSSRSYSSSSRSSGGFGSSKSTTTKRPTTTTYKSKTTTKPKAVVSKKTGGGFGATKKVDTNSAKYKSVNSKITKDFGTSTKKYKSKSAAKADLSSKMASKTYTYKDNASAMSHRPTNIPRSYQGHNTAYYGGHYGYYNPMGVFMMYTAQQMIISDMMVQSYAPQAVYHTRRPVSATAVITIFAIVAIGSIIVIKM